MRTVGNVIAGGVVGDGALGLPTEEREDREAVRARMEAKRARPTTSPFVGQSVAGVDAAYGTRSDVDPRAEERFTTPDLDEAPRGRRPNAHKTADEPAPAYVELPAALAALETPAALAAVAAPVLAEHPDVRAFLAALQDALDTSAEVVLADVRNATDRLRARSVANRRTAAASRGRTP